MLEIAVVVCLMLILMLIAIPIIQGTLYMYRLRSAVAAVTWAVQSTRYQALMEGYPFQVTFSAANNTYQLASDPTNSGTFANVGGAIPISSNAITLSATEAMQFKPYGAVIGSGTTLPPPSFQISYMGSSKTILVSYYGNVTVTSP
jgi:Tfp pilus assembly protein FimT